MIQKIRGLLGRALVALVVTGVVGTANVASAEPPAAAKIKVAAIPIDVSGTVYYAFEMGLFKKQNLDVEILSMGSGAAVAPAVASGNVDIGSSNFISLAQAHERGIPFLMIAPSGMYSMKSPTTQLIVAKSSPYKTAKDLNGKIIAVASLNNIASVTVSAWVDKNGGDYKSLKFVEVPFGQMAESVIAGRVDAAEIAEPFLTQALNSSARSIAADGDAIAPEFVEGGYFAMSDYVKNNPDVLRRFNVAIAEAGRWANKNVDAAEDILSKYSKRPVAKVLYHAVFPERFKPADAQPMIDAAARYGALKASFASVDMMAPDVIVQR